MQWIIAALPFIQQLLDILSHPQTTSLAKQHGLQLLNTIVGDIATVAKSTSPVEVAANIPNSGVSVTLTPARSPDPDVQADIDATNAVNVARFSHTGAPLGTPE